MRYGIKGGYLTMTYLFVIETLLQSQFYISAISNLRANMTKPNQTKQIESHTLPKPYLPSQSQPLYNTTTIPKTPSQNPKY